jgi:hypothetical protein
LLLVADTFCKRLPNQLSNELREIVEVLEAEVAKPVVSDRRIAGPAPARGQRSA